MDLCPAVRFQRGFQPLLAIRVAQAWFREFKASRKIMAETIADALKAEPLEEMKAEERLEELRRKQREDGEDS